MGAFCEAGVVEGEPPGPVRLGLWREGCRVL